MGLDVAVELANSEAELDELLEERRLEMDRPMRGAARDQLRRRYDRAEARLREHITTLRAQGGLAGSMPGEGER